MNTPLPRLAAALGPGLVTGLVLLGGCQSDPPTAPVADAPTASTTSTGAPDPGATPYTAAEIRAANPPGTTLVFRIEQPGQDPVHRTMQFLTDDAEGCDLEMWVQTADGRPLGEPERSSATWTELRDHAAFPPDRTTRAAAACTVPAGRFPCWLYVVGDETDGTLTSTRYYFAHTRPGPPVLCETEAAGAVTFRMALIEDSR